MMSLLRQIMSAEALAKIQAEHPVELGELEENLPAARELLDRVATVMESPIYGQIWGNKAFTTALSLATVQLHLQPSEDLVAFAEVVSMLTVARLES